MRIFYAQYTFSVMADFGGRCSQNTARFEATPFISSGCKKHPAIYLRTQFRELPEIRWVNEKTLCYVPCIQAIEYLFRRTCNTLASIVKQLTDNIFNHSILTFVSLLYLCFLKKQRQAAPRILHCFSKSINTPTRHP